MLKIIPLVFCWMSFQAWSQEAKTVRDMGIWTNVGVQYGFTKKWQVGFSEEARFFDNASKLSRLISEADMQYKIDKHFKLGGGVRYAYARKKDYTFTNDIRYHLDFNYKLKLGEKFELRYRLRFQNNYIDLFGYYDESRRKAHVRNRVELQYEHQKNTFYCNAELFREFAIYRTPYFNALRLNVGDQLKTKLGVMDYSFGYRRQLNDTHPLNFFFLRLGYTFKFKYA